MSASPIEWLLPVLPPATEAEVDWDLLPGVDEFPDRPLPPSERLDLVAELKAQLAIPGGNRVVLWGQAGLGKGVLARWAGYSFQEKYAQGCLRAVLSPAASEAYLARILVRWLRRMGRCAPNLPGSFVDLVRLWHDCLRHRQVLLILEADLVDVETAAWAIETLVPDVPGCSSVITSQRPLEGVGGTMIAVEPLDATAASAYLASITGGQQSDTQQRQALLEECRGLPLALELMGAAWMSCLGKWEDSWMPLPAVRAEASEGHLAVAQGFQRIFSQLHPAAQALLRRAVLLPIPHLDLSLAQCCLMEQEQEAAIALDQLVAYRCLVEVSPGQYDFRHDLIRSLAKNQLAIAESRSLRRRLRLAIAQWYSQRLIGVCRQLALAFQSEHSHQQAVMAVDTWLESHWINLMAVWEWVEQEQDWLCLLYLGTGLLAALPTAVINPMEAQLWAVLSTTIDEHQDLDQVLAYLLANQGNGYAYGRQYDQAQACYESSLSRFSRLEDPCGKAYALANLGAVCGHGSDEVQQQLWQKALELLPANTPERAALWRWMQQSSAAIAAELAEQPSTTTAAFQLPLLQRLWKKLTGQDA